MDKFSTAVKLSFYAFFAFAFVNCFAERFENNLFVTSSIELYLKSFPITQDATQKEEDQKTKKVQAKNLSEREQREIVFDIFAKQDQSISEYATSIDQTLLKNLEVFCGGQDLASHLFNVVKKVRTVAGEASLAHILSNPTYDQAVLKNRQLIAKELLANHDLLAQLETVLSEIKEVEPLVLSYWDKENPMNEDLLKRLYFGSFLSSLNKNPYALEVCTRIQHFLGGLSFVSIPFLISLEGALPEYIGAKERGAPISKTEALKRGIQKFGGFFSLSKKTFKDKSSQEAAKAVQFRFIQNLQTIGDWNYMFDNIPNPLVAPAMMKAGLIAGIAYLIGMQGYADYIIYEQIKLNSDLANYLQAKLIAVQTYVNAVKKLYTIIQNNPLLQNIVNIDACDSLTSSGFTKLLNMLNHNTFRGQASFCSLTGRVLAAHQLMKELKNEFAEFMPIVGKVDAHVSIAKLYQDYEHTPARYCFPEFIQSEKPYLRVVDFWNPMIDPQIVVTNSIEFGNKNPNNIILTGPNTGGKSTVIKSVVIDILLAQTLGIAPAQQLVFTPFAVINCSMNIADDISSGTSLFKAEVLRAKLFVERIKNLTSGQFAFTVMDEVFSGTSPKEGEEAAYLFTERLGCFDNSMCSVATHFPKLPDLEQESSFKNYQVTIFRAEDGSLIRPFKLEEGKSTMNVALDLLQQEGVFA